jgi:hypothetical protein
MFDYLARDRRRLRRGTRAFARAVDIGEACVFVDHGFQWDGSNNVWLTRARAAFVLEAGPEFDLRPRSLLNRMFGIGWRRAPIDPYFDEFFAVRTSSPGDAWDALTTRARTLLVGSFDDARLISDGHYVTLWREADFGREADAEAAAELVAEVVSFQIPVLDHLRRLPGAAYTPASGSWNDRKPPHVSISGPAPVRIGPTSLDGRPVIAVSAACGRATVPFSVRLIASGDDRASRDSLAAEALHAAVRDRPFGTRPPPSGGVADPAPAAPTPAASTRAARRRSSRSSADHRRRAGSVLDAARELGAHTLRCDGHQVTLYWHDLETGRDRLLSAASLVGSFASGQLGGLYR